MTVDAAGIRMTLKDREWIEREVWLALLPPGTVVFLEHLSVTPLHTAASVSSPFEAMDDGPQDKAE